MKILILQTGCGSKGGIANYISAVLSSINRSDFVFFVATSASVGLLEFNKIYLDSSQFKVNPTYGIIGFPIYIYNLVQFIYNQKIRLIHAHALRAAVPAVIVGLILRVPVVYTNHGLRFEQKKGKLKIVLFFIMEALVCFLSSSIVCIRRCDEYRIKNFLPKKIYRKVVVVGTKLSVGDKAFNNKRNEVVTLIGVGSLIMVKRPDRFIDWLIDIKNAGINFNARWIGGGPMIEECKRQSEIHGLNVTWDGHIERNEVLDLMSDSSFLLLTSDFEVMPLSVIEAMSQGLPTISSQFTGVDEVIEDGVTGYILQDGDNLGLSTVIKCHISDPKRCLEMRDRCRKAYLEKYSKPGIMSNHYYQIFKKLS